MNQTNPQTGAIGPVRQSIEVRLPPRDAFRLFTAQIGAWWPLGTHSVGGEKAVTAVLEDRAGGRLYERTDDGSEHDWGTVRVFEPGKRVVFSWHPGRGADTAQEVEVRFTATADGTRVELEHRGWEALGEAAADTRDGYVGGWEMVLGGCYANYCRTTESRT